MSDDFHKGHDVEEGFIIGWVVGEEYLLVAEQKVGGEVLGTLD